MGLVADIQHYSTFKRLYPVYLDHIARLLQGNPALANQKEEGVTPLAKAVELRQLNVINLLLAYKAQIESLQQLLDIVGMIRISALLEPFITKHLLKGLDSLELTQSKDALNKLLIEAIKSKNDLLVVELLKLGADPMRANRGKECVSLAITRHSNPHIVAELLSQCTPEELQEKCNSPLHTAVLLNRTEYFPLLCQYGNGVLRYSKNREGLTPLDLAMRDYKYVAGKELLSFYDLSTIEIDELIKHCCFENAGWDTGFFVAYLQRLIELGNTNTFLSAVDQYASVIEKDFKKAALFVLFSYNNGLVTLLLRHGHVDTLKTLEQKGYIQFDRSFQDQFVQEKQALSADKRSALFTLLSDGLRAARFSDYLYLLCAFKDNRDCHSVFVDEMSRSLPKLQAAFLWAAADGDDLTRTQLGDLLSWYNRTVFKSLESSSEPPSRAATPRPVIQCPPAVRRSQSCGMFACSLPSSRPPTPSTTGGGPMQGFLRSLSAAPGQ